MELAQQAETYVPCIGEDGRYIDVVPSASTFSLAGIRCACGCRNEKIYSSRAKFVSHIKTQVHKNWLRQMYLNNSNYYAKVQELEKVVQSQKIMIGRLEVEVKNRDVTIHTLISQFANKEKNVIVPIEDLLDL